MQGASPLASPGLNPGGTCSPCHCGARRGGEPPAALARPAPGERTISNAEVPLPRSPLSLAAGTANREPLPIVFAANRKLLARGARMAEAVSAANGLMQGCRGRSPRRNKLKISPFPGGEGGWGDGGRKSSYRQGRQATKTTAPPHKATRRQGRQAANKASPPPARDMRPCSSAARVQPRGCKGRSPLHKKTKNLPLPAGKGAGGMGARKKAKGGGGRWKTKHATRRAPPTPERQKSRESRGSPLPPRQTSQQLTANYQLPIINNQYL